MGADEDLVGPRIQLRAIAPVHNLSSGKTLLTALAGGEVALDFPLWGEQRLPVGIPVRAKPAPAPQKLPQGHPDTGKFKLPAGAALESTEEMAALSMPELRARFEAKYGVKCVSNNRVWLFKKLTGQKQVETAAAASGSAVELQQPAAGEKRKGATIVHTRVAGGKFLPLADVMAMSMAEKRAAFTAIYGEATKSGNGGWLERKLTGRCRGRAAKRGRSSD